MIGCKQTPYPGKHVLLMLFQWALLASLAFWPRPWLVLPTVMAGASALAAWRWRSVQPLLLGSFVTLSALGWALIPLAQLAFALALGLTALGLRRVEWIESATAWWVRGESSPMVWLLALLSAAVAAVALLGWFRLVTPDLSDIRRVFIGDWPTWLLVAGGGGFALLNAALEESIYRGLLQDALARTMGSPRGALVLQALAFGLLHIRGFPRGWGGVALATVYGLMMGGLRLRARGLLGPWVSHVLTDAAIVAIMLYWVRG
jgi:membrane protease YdiL (CAAX protease family)